MEASGGNCRGWSLAASSLLCCAFALYAGSTAAQPVGSDSGPLSEVSRSLQDSQPVHERGRTVTEGTVGSMKSGPVRDGRRRSMLSGPVSEISVGPVTAGQPMTGGGSVTESSAGAVKHSIDHSLGEQVYDAQRALRPLQDRLRLQPDTGGSDSNDALEDLQYDDAHEQGHDAGEDVQQPVVTDDVAADGQETEPPSALNEDADSEEGAE